MGRFTQPLNAFNGGEVSPRLYGRSDIQKYDRAAAVIRNFLIQAEGGLLRRSGTRFVKPIFDQTAKVKLVPFIYSTEQAYMLVFSALKIHVYYDEGAVLHSSASRSTVTNITEANPAVVTLADHGVPDGRLVTVTGVVDDGPGGDVSTALNGVQFTATYIDADSFSLDIDGSVWVNNYASGGTINVDALAIEAITVDSNPLNIQITAHSFSTGDEVYIDTASDVPEINGRFFKITRVDADNFTLTDEDGSAAGYTSWSSGGTVDQPITVTTTYTQTEIAELTFAQSADVLYIAHKDHAPAKLGRTGHTLWTLSDVSFVDGPFYSINATATTMNPSGTGDGTIAASDTEGINGDAGFRAADVGRLIRCEDVDSNVFAAGYGVIDAINSTTNVDVTNSQKWSGDTKDTWRLGAFWPANYPAAVSFAEGRLWWGGEPERPHSIYGSESGNFDAYGPTQHDLGALTITDANGITYIIGSNQVNNVLWMSVGRSLAVGTPGAIFPVRASGDTEPVTPTNINVQAGSPVGAAAIRPVTVGSSIVYVDRTKKRLRAFRYALQDDSYIADDLTRIADHVSASPISEIDYQLTPDSIIWCARTDGKLVALTYVPEEEVFAWARHQIGGDFSTGDAVVENVAVIPSPDGGHDQVWMCVKRTVNSVTTRYIEFLEDQFEPTTDITDSFFVDSGLTYDDSPATVFYGLNHLEGETVQVLADGMHIADKTVANGQITLDTAASTVHIGLAYNSDLQTLRVDASPAGGKQAQSTQGLLKRIDGCILRVSETNCGKFGRDSSDLLELPIRSTRDNMNEPTPLFSGDLNLGPPPGWDREGQLYFRQDKPLPFNILSMTLTGQAGES